MYIRLLESFGKKKESRSVMKTIQN